MRSILVSMVGDIAILLITVFVRPAIFKSEVVKVQWMYRRSDFIAAAALHMTIVRLISS